MGNTKMVKSFQKTKLAEERKGFFILFFGVIAIFGFLLVLMPLGQLTGNVIGELRGNLYGAYFIIIFLIVWSAIVVFWNLKNKGKEEVNVKKLIKSS